MCGGEGQGGVNTCSECRERFRREKCGEVSGGVRVGGLGLGVFVSDSGGGVLRGVFSFSFPRHTVVEAGRRWAAGHEAAEGARGVGLEG